MNSFEDGNEILTARSRAGQERGGGGLLFRSAQQLLLSHEGPS
jgi:hypothetical protein